NVASPAGQNLTVSGGGIMTGTTSVNITATDSSANHPSLIFGGSQTFNGTTNLNASGAGQALVVQNGANVSGNNTVFVNASSITLQGTGTLNGNPLVINASGGAGTISNNTGDVILPTALTFNGQSLAIVASGNIRTSTLNPGVQINLNSSNGAGGN